MTAVKFGCYLLVALVLVYVTDAKGVRTSNIRSRSWLRSVYDRATQRPNNWNPTPGRSHHPVTPGTVNNANTGSPRYGGNYPRVTPYPTAGSDTGRPRHGDNYPRVTPYPTAGSDTGRPRYGGNHHQFTPDHTNNANTRRPRYFGNYQRVTPYPTADTNTARPRYGGNHHQFTPDPIDDTNTGRPNYGGNHHGTNRPYHRYPEQTTPVPTANFHAQLQRYLRKLTHQRQLSQGAPEKKSINIQTLTDHVHCPNHRVPCHNTGVCIDTAWICDGENDCIDWSDEDNCSV